MRTEEFPYEISFFVPCLNEEGNIGRSIDTILEVMRGREQAFEIVVVDDASSDGTVHEVEKKADASPETAIVLIKNPFCRGLGRNYFIAAQRARGRHYMLVNGDAAEPPETIRRILDHMGEADAVIPYFGLNETRTWFRRMLSRLFTSLVNLLSGHDLQYYNGPVIHLTENVRAWSSATAGFGYQAELLCRLLDEGISFTEVQVANTDRERGASKALTLKNLLSVGLSLTSILLRRIQLLFFHLFSSGEPLPPGKGRRIPPKEPSS